MARSIVAQSKSRLALEFDKRILQYSPRERQTLLQRSSKVFQTSHNISKGRSKISVMAEKLLHYSKMRQNLRTVYYNILEFFGFQAEVEPSWQDQVDWLWKLIKEHLSEKRTEFESGFTYFTNVYKQKVEDFCSTVHKLWVQVITFRMGLLEISIIRIFDTSCK